MMFSQRERHMSRLPDTVGPLDGLDPCDLTRCLDTASQPRIYKDREFMLCLRHARMFDAQGLGAAAGAAA